MIKWLRQKFCRHTYRKHWVRASGTYERRCTKCGKVE